jgi:hypothetical protein
MTLNTAHYYLHFTNGRKDTIVDSYRAAIAMMQAEYPNAVTEHDGDLTDGGDCTWIWAYEASSVNDDGANAVASIRKA